MSSTLYSLYQSPAGRIVLTQENSQLTGLWFEGEKHSTVVDPSWQRDEPSFKTVHQQLDAYFAGKLEQFDLPLKISGTPFQERVWKALCEIPFGQTWSYAQLARHIGNPKAVRAVGTANGRNPISIIVPCHRVIGAEGSLVGYGGGLDKKTFLLQLEKVIF